MRQPEPAMHRPHPCGICQERLAFWGDAVQVAVPHEDDPTRWESKSLKEVQPYSWLRVYSDT